MEKKLDALADDVKQLKAKERLQDIDNERKILELEDAVISIKKKIGSIILEDEHDTESAKKVQDSLSQIEDLSLEDRLNVVNMEASVKDSESKIDVLNGKLNLISDAVKILNQKTSLVSEQFERLPANSADVDGLKSTVDGLESTVSDIVSRKPVFAEDMKAVDSRIESVSMRASEIAGVARDSIKAQVNHISHIEKKLNLVEKDMSSLQAEARNLHQSSLGDFERLLDSKVSGLKADLNTNAAHHHIRKKIDMHEMKFDNFRELLNIMVNMIEGLREEIDALKGAAAAGGKKHVKSRKSAKI